MTSMKKPETLDDFRTLPAATWRSLTPQALGHHVQAYRGALMGDVLKMLPTQQRSTPGQGPQSQQKTRITMAALSRINADTKTYPPLGKDSIAVTKALAKNEHLTKEDQQLCGKLAMLCEVRAKEAKQKRQESAVA